MHSPRFFKQYSLFYMNLYHSALPLLSTTPLVPCLKFMASYSLIILYIGNVIYIMYIIYNVNF